MRYRNLQVTKMIHSFQRSLVEGFLSLEDRYQKYMELRQKDRNMNTIEGKANDRNFQEFISLLRDPLVWENNIGDVNRWTFDRTRAMFLASYVPFNLFNFDNLLFQALLRGYDDVFNMAVKRVTLTFDIRKKADNTKVDPYVLGISKEQFVAGIGKTMLKLIRMQNMERVIQFLDMGIDPNMMPYKSKSTLLLEAVRDGYPQFVKLLLTRGASPNRQPEIMLSANKHKNIEIIEMLQKKL